MAIVPPFAPRITDELELLDDAGPGNVEIDRNLVVDVDFTGVVRLSADVSRFENSVLTGLALDRLELTDVMALKLEAAALQAYKTRMLRVAVADSRCTGAEFAEGSFEDCLFKNVKFDETGFRFASFKRVTFETCMLRSSDFSNAKFEQVVFRGCDMDAANFVSAHCKSVDVTTEDLIGIKGLLGLKGATISSEQLMQLVPLLASELGFHVENS